MQLFIWSKKQQQHFSCCSMKILRFLLSLFLFRLLTFVFQSTAQFEFCSNKNKTKDDAQKKKRAIDRLLQRGATKTSLLPLCVLVDQRWTLLNDVIWQDFTEQLSKFEFVDDGIKSKTRFNVNSFLSSGDGLSLELSGRFHLAKAKRENKFFASTNSTDTIRNAELDFSSDRTEKSRPMHKKTKLDSTFSLPLLQGRNAVRFFSFLSSSFVFAWTKKSTKTNSRSIVPTDSTNPRSQSWTLLKSHRCRFRWNYCFSIEHILQAFFVQIRL